MVKTRKKPIYEQRNIKTAKHSPAKTCKRVTVHEGFEGKKTRKISLDSLEKRTDVEVVINFNKPNESSSIFGLCFEYNKREVYVQASHSKPDLYHGTINPKTTSYTIEECNQSNVTVMCCGREGYKDLAKLIVMRR
ncbi:MAG: hypothetical protein Q8N99_07905 [Nanoarchaeota archaeon]|nr:hypothetical protein [Nanoarchaeota archaeon]